MVFNATSLVCYSLSVMKIRIIQISSGFDLICAGMIDLKSSEVKYTEDLKCVYRVTARLPS